MQLLICYFSFIHYIILGVPILNQFYFIIEHLQCEKYTE